MRKACLIALALITVFMFRGAFAPCALASEKIPERIVSLAPSVTEELYLLGAEDRLVGNTTYCVTPPAARHKVKVGAITNIDLERIVELRPDLVLATSLTDPKAVQKLKDLGIGVMVFPAPKDFVSLCSQFLELGKAVGREAKAGEIIREAEKKAAAIRDRVASLVKPNVFIEIGAKPLFTANKGYFLNDFIRLAGGTNIAEDAKVGAYSREEVLRKNADVIIIVTMGIAGEKEKEAWQKFKTLNAVRRNRIHVIDSRRACSPTPVTFIETLEEISALLHPELSKKGI